MSLSWNSPPPTYNARSVSHTSLKPYLSLSHLLSLTWLAYPILSLIFIAFRLQMSLASAQDTIVNAKGDLLSSCKAAEQAATAAASMPRYLALASNQQFADAVNGSINAARAALVLALTIMEAIINFIIDIYRSTFLCFLELVIRGGLAIIIGAVKELSDVVQSVTGGLRTSIQNDITSANSAIQTVIDTVNKINPLGDIKAPQIPVPNLDGLQNISIPQSFQDSLSNLNSSLPTFNDLKQKIESIVDTPFELVKKDINDTFSGLGFNSSILPVPKQNLLSFCNDLDLSVIDDLGRDLIKTAQVGTVILILLALLLVGLNCLLEWYKWRCMKRHLEYTRQAWTSDPTIYHPKGISGPPQVSLTDHNLLMLQGNMTHPLLTRIANNMSRWFRLTPSQHTHLQWFFSYIFHPPALACFLIGVLGLLSVQLQLLAMGPLVHKYSDRAASTVTDFSNSIATSINASMYNQSAAYANDVNGRVDAIQLTINNGVFGWVNGTTTTLNTTIVEFYAEIQNAVSTVFNGTILEQPAQEFIRCLIGSKVDAIENALTFLHDNLKIDMPRVNQSALVLSPESVNEATRPIAAAAIGGGNDDDQGLIGRLVNSYAATLKKERIMFLIFIGIWGFVVLMALCIIFWHSYGKGWMEARKRRRWEREQRVGIDGIVVPFRGQPVDEKYVGSGGIQPHQDLPAFTPLPSPKGGELRPNRPVSSMYMNSPTPKPEKSWRTLLGLQAAPKPGPPVISGPMKLMALGRAKTRGVDTEAAYADPASTPVDKGDRNTAWFGRVATMLGKKSSEPESPGLRSRHRPNLRISIDRASSVRSDLPHIDTNPTPGQQHDDRATHSRWSASPEATKPSMQWKDLISPKKSVHQPIAIGVPIRTSKPRHTANVPSDVSTDTLVAPMQPTPFAPPLHHGFEKTSPPPPHHSPRMPQPQFALAPPPEKHRRSLSVPSWKAANDARQSPSPNPFITPFDDEHRVVTITCTTPRKSIPTNPFSAVAL
ncbi:hypothetical protein BD779DRAFT_1436024 [Infundibulicybe gibba]|nr:hypothetical protein BD779DRAFT_1436024 [Infundibulicybe gibba]